MSESDDETTKGERLSEATLEDKENMTEANADNETSGDNRGAQLQESALDGAISSPSEIEEVTLDLSMRKDFQLYGTIKPNRVQRYYTFIDYFQYYPREAANSTTFFWDIVDISVYSRLAREIRSGAVPRKISSSFS